LLQVPLTQVQGWQVEPKYPVAQSVQLVPAKPMGQALHSPVPVRPSLQPRSPQLHAWQVAP